MSKQKVLSVGALTIAAAGAAGLLMLGSSASGAVVAHGQSAGQRADDGCCEVDAHSHNKNKNVNVNVNVNKSEMEMEMKMEGPEHEPPSALTPPAARGGAS